MRLKDDNVSLSGLSTAMLFAIQVANELWGEHATELVITSVNDGRHSLTSLHYAFEAVDLRSRTLPDARAVRDELKRRLRIDYDVVVEDEDGPNAHIHVEHQPRRRG